MKLNRCKESPAYTLRKLIGDTRVLIYSNVLRLDTLNGDESLLYLSTPFGDISECRSMNGVFFMKYIHVTTGLLQQSSTTVVHRTSLPIS